jgi:alpha-D-xyloside xylohydrolase
MDVTPRLSELVDVSPDFWKAENQVYLPASVAQYDAAAASGLLNWRRHVRSAQIHFNYMDYSLMRAPDGELPPVYPKDPALPFSVEFVTERTLRIRLRVAAERRPEVEELMLAGPVRQDGSWLRTDGEGRVTYTSRAGVSVTVSLDPWAVEVRDADGRVLTRTWTGTHYRSMPFAFVRRVADMRREIAASFTLAPEEMVFGCGESFSRLNKRGQQVVLWPFDAWECQGADMYKPIPFFLSSRGYGMFLHTSAPVTFDFGRTHDAVNTIYTGDDELDLFLFVGTPKEVLAEYTALTGRSPVPPLWSFGLWMSRITYDSEQQARSVAARLRHERVPCDVIHLDTGWFELDWCCDYRFSASRFKDPAQMMRDLREQGFRISLWQLPYFTPANRLYREAIDKGYVVRAPDGALPTEDAILDFSNPEAVRWYQGLLAGLFDIGAAAVKVDFGEAGPVHGQYASGRSGFFEHNLYPLRYNKAAADITLQKTGEHIIWARSAWAGSQRYPMHWGGDTHTTDGGMAAEIRAGISFGLCGFSFWSHDIGGFTGVPDTDLYARWLAFGMLCSHSRCHGQPPREPWEFGAEFTDVFRRVVELKYRLMPYVYAQAAACSQAGLPMVRALFVESPDDPGSWLVDDEYLFGADLLVAPLLEHGVNGRNVYLPPGTWHDFQSGRTHDGPGWKRLQAGELPVVLLVRDGAAVPMVEVAQSTDDIDWGKVTLRVFATGPEARALFCLPADGVLHELSLKRRAAKWSLSADPTEGRVKWAVEGWTPTGMRRM